MWLIHDEKFLSVFSSIARMSHKSILINKTYGKHLKYRGQATTNDFEEWAQKAGSNGSMERSR
jgi:hypothetical protein